MEYIILLIIVVISYAMGYVSHNHHLRYDYEELQRAYNQLYNLDNHTIHDLKEEIHLLEKELGRRATEK